MSYPVSRDPTKDFPWMSIKETPPPARTIVLLTGDSGYTTYGWFIVVGYYDAEYRPRSPWIGVTLGCLGDFGWTPTHWAAVPLPPPKTEGG